MIPVLQWSTFVVCALVAVLRFPAALRGENRSLFGIFTLAAFAMLLSIQWSYNLIDGWLGGHNYTNLLLRFVVYGTTLLAGYKIAKGFDDSRGLRLLLGPVGRMALLAVTLATVIPFLLADTAGTAVGLAALPNQSEYNRELIGLYTAAGRLYPAFVAACLLPATITAVRSRLPRLIRSGAAVLSVGSAAMILMAFSELLPLPLRFLQYFISSAAVLGLVVGLALIWLGKVRSRRAARKAPLPPRPQRATHATADIEDL